jgi:hypothetical protein
VLESEVYDSVRIAGPAPKDFDVVEVARQHCGTPTLQLRGSLVGASEADYVMAGLQQFWDHGRTDPSGCTGYEYAHATPPGDDTWCPPVYCVTTLGVVTW